MNTWYYPKTIKNIIIALSDMFNDLVVKRTNNSGIVTKTINVPLKFGPVHKFFQIQKEVEETNGNYYLNLPGLAITLDGISYASDRARGVNEVRHIFDENIGLDSTDEFWSDANPTPYDLTFTVHILTEAMDDFCQIVENILPYFNPMLSLRVKEFSFLNMERDLPVKLGSVNTEFLEPQQETEVRYVNGSITLTVHAFMFRPISNVKVIKEIRTRFFVNEYMTGSGFDVSGVNSNSTSSFNLLTSQYNVSGFTTTSAINIIPTSEYDFSVVVDGYNLLTSGSTSALINAKNYY